MQFIKLFFIFILWSSYSLAGEVVGKIASIKGEVLINNVSANEGQALSEGAIVQTKSGKCTLLLGKDNVIHLDQNSRFKVVKMGAVPEKQSENKSQEAVFNLEYGKTRALIKNEGGRKNFQFRSKSATLGVRGTHVYIDSPMGNSAPQQFTVMEGAASVFYDGAGQEGGNRGDQRRESVDLATGMAVQLKEEGKGSSQGENAVKLGEGEVKQLASEITRVPPVTVLEAESLRRSDDSITFKEQFGYRFMDFERQGQLGLDPTKDGKTVNVQVGISLQ